MKASDLSKVQNLLNWHECLADALDDFYGHELSTDTRTRIVLPTPNHRHVDLACSVPTVEAVALVEREKATIAQQLADLGVDVTQ